MGFSLVAASRGYYSLASVHGFLITVASGAAEHRLIGCTGSGAAACGLRSCGTRSKLPYNMWNLPGPESKPKFPALAGGFLTTGPPGKSPS